MATKVTQADIEPASLWVIIADKAVSAHNSGNGFLFEHFDAEGLMWAMDQAMAFFEMSIAERSPHVKRIMAESIKGSDSNTIAMPYIHLYRRILEGKQVNVNKRFDWTSFAHIAA